MGEPGVTKEALEKSNNGREPVINDFSIVVATVNGTGSQTANTALMRALFRMGIPVSGKNLFPSNIQGLPTWFTIRANRRGYTAHKKSVEILVAMNLTTFKQDLESLCPGGACFYPDDLPLTRSREDVAYYPMPVKELVRLADPPRELRDYIANMVYVGVVSEILQIEITEIRAALETHFQGKAKPVKMNMDVVEQAAEWARQNLTKQDPFYVQRDSQTEGLIILDGNTAAALGSIYGGMNFAAWYPITPASSMVDAVNSFIPLLRRDPESGKLTCAVLQAEDELAAIGMTVGAGWAGARAMTSTSGPGISLMTEFAGLAFFAEVPVVVWDVQRMGPSTGLPTRTSQGDVLKVRYLGHGDTKQVVLLPGSVFECFEFGWRSLDIADRLQTPVFVLIDLDLGMNIWMSPDFAYPDTPMDQGKVLSAEDLDKLTEYARYRDVDGDGIAYRTLPGTDHPLAAWFARGTGHNESAGYSEDPEDWEKNMKRLWRKMETARQFMPAPVIDQGATPAAIGMIAYGSTDPAVEEARDRLSAAGIATDYMRLRAIPFTAEVEEFVAAHDRCYVVEMNMEGQMRQVMTLELPAIAAKLHSITENNGIPLTAQMIVKAVMAKEEV